MKPEMDRAKRKVEALLASKEATAGMSVRIHGAHLILAREEQTASGKTEAEERVRLTRMGTSRWGLSVKRHNGRWEQTPFSGSVPEVLDAVWTFMQHLVGPY